MPIPLFTEKSSNSETAQSSQAETVRSTPLAPETPPSTDATSGDTARSSTVEPMREEQEAADKAYLERMEEEYAKREGGA